MTPEYGYRAGQNVRLCRAFWPAGFFFLLIVFAWMFASCESPPVPKPRGYFRIDLPEQTFHTLKPSCPFLLEYPAVVSLRPEDEPCWFTLSSEAFNMHIYLTYKPVLGNLTEYLSDAGNMIYRSVALKADAVDEYLFAFPDRKVYGTLYHIQGNAASPVQFYATDSVQHFLRGSLYYGLPPDQDSLAPVVGYFTESIWHMVRSLRWQE